ncbi:MAG TPA: F0F1 ATP synthase subunit delta [Gammaproteobacteria bacterium]|nr:F0F1 ATP synthase subunit delta [Gammaproteobacteria bacterium]
MSKKYTIARPYAKAAFSLAQTSSQYEAWSQMLQLGALMAQDPAFVELLKDPKFPDAMALEWLLSIGKELITKEGEQFFNLLSDNQRLLFLPEIAELYEELKLEAEKVIKASVISAQPLDENNKARIREALQSRFHASEIELDCKVDKNLLAGAIVRAGDLVIDGTARGRLRRIEEALGI